MELKKNKKIDLERRTPLFFAIGLVISMSLVLVAFEWKSEYEPIEIAPRTDKVDPLYIPQITRHKDPEPPKPKAEKKAVVKKSNNPPVIIEKKDEEEIQETIKIDDLIPDDFTAVIDENEGYEEAEKIFDFVESDAQYPGGNKAFLEFLASQINYPRNAARMGVEGTVILQYVINTDGTITDIEIIKGIGFGCDEEAKRVLAMAPNWTPGKQRGIPVRVRQRVPIKFKLGN